MTGRMGSLRRAAGLLVVLALALVTVLLTPRALAAPEPPASAAAPAPASNEDESGPSSWQAGPARIELDHGIELELSAAYRFLPKEPAKKALEKNGNYHNENLLGLAASAEGTHAWFAVLTYDEEGYIKDDEKIDADELLSGMRDGVKELNAERQKHGFNPLAVEGWADPPRYDRSRHELVWALVVSDPDGKSVNYNTRVLGRRGYVSLDLVTDPEQLGAHRSDASALLAGTHFVNGARYQDFDAKKDKVAEYGLAGLIMAGAGLGAAKLIKIGLIAKFWKVILALIIAGKKAVAAAVIGALAFFKRLFGAKKKDEPQVAPPP